MNLDKCKIYELDTNHSNVLDKEIANCYYKRVSLLEHQDILKEQGLLFLFYTCGANFDEKTREYVPLGLQTKPTQVLSCQDFRSSFTNQIVTEIEYSYFYGISKVFLTTITDKDQLLLTNRFVFEYKFDTVNEEINWSIQDSCHLLHEKMLTVFQLRLEMHRNMDIGLNSERLTEAISYPFILKKD